VQTTVRFADVDDDTLLPIIGRADDFIARGLFVTEACITGAYTDADIDCNPPTGFNRCDCACMDDNQLNCIPQTQDAFTVCVWEDAGLAGVGFSSIPGDLVHCTSTTYSRTNNYGPDSGFNFDEYTIALLLDDQIPTVEGEIYWLQVYDDTSIPTDNTCNFYWASDGDLDGGDDGDETPSGNDVVMHDLDPPNWEQRDIRSYDHAFCLNYSVEPPPVPALGACCLCDPLGDCTDNVAAADCFGIWKLGQTCAPGLCPVARPVNDDCDSLEPGEGIITITDGLYPFDNICATTDGPDSVDCGGTVATDIGGDIWYAYTATCSGNLTVDMCADADYDGMLEIYTDGTSVCPCPTDESNKLVCGDDTCGTTFGPAVVEAIVEQGVCYSIRVAGWRSLPDDEIPSCESGCQGSGSFTVSCGEISCTLPLPSTPIDDVKCPPEGCEQGFGSKVRYLSFSGGDVGKNMAARVTFVSLPGYEYAEGRQMWVQEPSPITEASGSDLPTPPPTMWGATLGCNQFGTDWTAYDTVDIFDDAMVPGGIYDIQFIDINDNTAADECYSDPLTVRLSGFGDVVGNRTAPPPAAPPQGVIDFGDIGQIVDKFKNLPTAPRKARADIVNSTLPAPRPDNKVDFVDISCAVDAFRGSPCWHEDWGPPASNPCAR